MRYQELEKSHRNNFTKGGNAEYIELCRRISALAYSLTGERIVEAKSLAVTKGTVITAASMLGFEYDGQFSSEAYYSAHEFLGNYILETTNPK